MSADLIGNLTLELNQKGIIVMWLPRNQIKRKFSYNTNIRHEDDIGRDLHLKSIDELCQEFSHCGDELVLMLHDIMDGPYKGSQLIYYDSWD